ncbi:MAG: ISNCY family transposase [Vulcanimicrobiaceae bacterium]
MWRAFKDQGEQGLVSRRRGRPSNRSHAEGFITRAIVLVREHYADFGPTLASEKLLERHGIELNRETLRQAMIAADLWKSKRRRRHTLHLPRERRPRFGQLVQIDGSPHSWFEERGPRCTLLVFIDDATSKLVALRFVKAETTNAYCALAHEYFTRFGIPEAFYCDRFGVFRINLKDAPRSELTQFGRAMDRLGIELICANSPQAKGRVERVNQTLQDRLVKELRLAGINDIEAGNQFLQTYVDEHNARFAVPAREHVDAHRPLRVSDDLEGTLACRYQRKLTKDLLFQFESNCFRITTKERRIVFPRALVEIVELLDGSIRIERNGVHLDFELVGHRRTVPIRSSKELRDRASDYGVPNPKKAHTPPKMHPWRVEKRRDVIRALVRKGDISKLRLGDTNDRR